MVGIKLEGHNGELLITFPKKSRDGVIRSSIRMKQYGSQRPEMSFFVESEDVEEFLNKIKLLWK